MSRSSNQAILQTRDIAPADAARMRLHYLESLILKRYDKHWLYSAVQRTMVPTGTVEVNAFNALSAAMVVAEDAALGGIDSNYMAANASVLLGARLRMTVRGSASTLSLAQAGMVNPIATALVVGREYCIEVVGSTNWTLCGAANNNVGTIFVCTAVGTGNGSAFETNFFWAGNLPSASTTKFTLADPTVSRQDLTLQTHRARVEISNELLTDLPPSGYQTLCDSLAMVLLESITARLVGVLRGFAEAAGQISNVAVLVTANDPMKLLMKLPQTARQSDDAVLMCSTQAFFDYCDSETPQQVTNTLRFRSEGGYDRICGARVIISDALGTVSDDSAAAMIAFPLSQIRLYETPLMVSIDSETKRGNNVSVIHATHRAVGTALFPKQVYGLSFAAL